jgi:hypothetical protein
MPWRDSVTNYRLAMRTLALVALLVVVRALL